MDAGRGASVVHTTEGVSAAATEVDGSVLTAFILRSGFAEVRYIRCEGSSSNQMTPRSSAAPSIPTNRLPPADLLLFARDGADADHLRAVVAGCMLFAGDLVLWLAAAHGAVP
jgi:hypothetical protein